MIAIGLDLEEVKNKLPRGQFVLWIQSEFGMGQAAAYRFMQVASRFKDNFINLVNLPISILYELAAPSTPETVIEEVIEGKIGTHSPLQGVLSEVQKFFTKCFDLLHLTIACLYHFFQKRVCLTQGMG